jgi:uncharacterized membrane protein YbhN (UPF0104 family)
MPFETGITRRHVVLALVGVAALAALATAPQLLGTQVTDALEMLLDVSPAWLWLAALSFAGALVASGCAWQSALCRCGADVSRGGASARYGIGSLVNAFLPGKVGTAVRLALFSRVLHGEGRLWTTGGIGASVGVARSIWLALLLAFGAATGVLPSWPLAVLALAVAAAVAAALFARDRAPNARVAHVLDAFRVLGRCPRAAAQLVGWIGVATAARIGAATAIAAAFGIEQPLLAALLVVPALDLAGILPLTPGNVGIASAAVAFALHAHGAAADVALSAGIAFSAVETVTSLTFGLGSALYLAGGVPGIRRSLATAAAATACLALGVAFGATVVLPLV